MRADVDAIASAGALYHAFGKKVKVGIPDHIGLPAKKFAQSLKIPYSLNPSLSKFDVVVLVDCHSKAAIGSMGDQVNNFKGKLVIFDHHEKTSNEFLKKAQHVLDPKASSCSLLIYHFLKKSRVKITKKIAQCVATGILTDSAHFVAANTDAFAVMGDCIAIGKFSLPELFPLFSVKKDASEKIAAIKAAKRARIFRAGDFIFVFAEVGAFEADAASALIRIGADLAFVGTSENGKMHVSGRANNVFLRHTKSDLAQVMQGLEKEFEGEGGGHPGAAGFNGIASSFDAVGEACVRIAFKQVKKKYPSLQLKEYTK